MAKPKHWTESMFIDHPELFMLYLEERRKTARKEALALKRIFDSRGVPGRGRILDSCCGIGRHSIELASLGYEMVGVDLAPAHIERAEQLARKRGISKRTKFLVGDMRRIRGVVGKLGEFDAVINMFTSFGYYGEEADLNFFRDLNRLSRKDAVLALETINRDWIIKNMEGTGIFALGNVEQHDFRRFNFENSFMENIWKFYKIEGEERRHLATFPVVHRIYSAHELIKMLKSNGWKDINVYGNLKLAPLDLRALTNRLVVVASN